MDKIKLNEKILNDKEQFCIDKILNNFKNVLNSDIENNTHRCFNSKKRYEFFNNAFIVQDELIGNIEVEYFIYVVLDKTEKELFIKHRVANINCEADYDDKKIIIRNIYQKDIKSVDYNDIYSDLYHEYHHLYQYSQGFTKNVNLYDTVIKGMSDNDILIKYTSHALYYTFRHEEDAFMMSIYQELINNKNKYKLDSMTIDDVASMCQPYQNFKTAVKAFDDMYYEDPEIINKLSDYFGISASSINARINTTYNRFDKKFRNVLEKALINRAYNGHRFVSETFRYYCQKINEGLIEKDDISFIENVDEIKYNF